MGLMTSNTKGQIGELVRVIPSKRRRKHRIEDRVYAREIRESFCVQKGCRFHGQRAQQGVCHTTKPMAVNNWGYTDAVFDYASKWANEQMAERRKRYLRNPKDYIKHLEAALWCQLVNTTTGLDELVRLRARLAIAEDELRRLRKKGGRRA